MSIRVYLAEAVGRERSQLHMDRFSLLRESRGACVLCTCSGEANTPFHFWGFLPRVVYSGPLFVRCSEPQILAKVQTRERGVVSLQPKIPSNLTRDRLAVSVLGATTLAYMTGELYGAAMLPHMF